ncbi:hypothetical protein WR25_00445 [Diploscapter pachys]|uniref:Uncharacterized protein n=1 Tax=Diploscapter pachys TaxID=2018661 RepID=A0A2A2M5A9_9BILA|nr:hypothetical protein WR25_00445 [Diploscapter pachys]
MQGNRLRAIGGGFLAGLAQGEHQAAGGHALDILQHLASLVGVDGRAEAHHKADLVLPGRAAVLGEGGQGHQQPQQRASEPHRRPARPACGWRPAPVPAPVRWPACAPPPARRHTG